MEQLKTPFDENPAPTDPQPQNPAEPAPGGQTDPEKEKNHVAEMYEKTMDQMNEIRKEEEKHPLVSEKYDFIILKQEFEGAENFLKKISVRKIEIFVFEGFLEIGRKVFSV